MMKKLVNRIMLCLFMTLLLCHPFMSVHAIEKKVVRVSAGINKSLYLDENHQPQGYCSDYLNSLASINNWQLEYVEGSWNESVQNLIDGKIDIIFPIQKTPERVDTMLFSNVIGGYQPIALFASSQSDFYYQDYASYHHKKIAVTKDSSNEIALKAYAKQHQFTYEAVYLESSDDKRKALDNGSVDLSLFSMINESSNLSVVDIIDYLPFYYAVNKNNTTLYDELNEGMKQIFIRQPEKASDVYLDFLNEGTHVALTKEEHDFIKSEKPVTVGFYANTSPLSNVDDQGNASGIYLDVLKIIKEKSGLNIKTKVISRKDYAPDLLQQGKISFLIGANNAIMSSSNNHFLESNSIMDYMTVAVSKKDFKFKDNKKVTFGLTNARKYWKSFLEDKYPKASIKYYKDAKSCLNAVQADHVDATLLNTWEYNYQSKNARFENLIEWENFRIPSHTIMIASQDEDPILISIINKSINQISSKEIDDIITYNLNIPYNDYSFEDYLYASRGTLFIIASILVLVFAIIIVIYFLRRKYVKQLKYKNQQLQRALSTKNQFLSRMSHELRTPLNTIDGYTYLLENEELQPETKDKLKSIKNSSHYLLSLINDVLDIQNIELGELVLHPEIIKTKEYLYNIYEMTNEVAKKKNVHFEYEKLTEICDYFYGDRSRIQQILLNILNNAIKFTDCDGHVKMQVSMDEQDERNVLLKFVIIDDGIGMAKEFVEHNLFNAFSQEDTQRTSPYSGVGVGLTISRELAKLMDGDITCQSELNKGSEFIITVHVEIPCQEDVANYTRLSSHHGYNLNNMRILLCEDNEINQAMTKRLLEKMKAQVDVANNGQEGLEMFKQSELFHYSFILMDIRMPIMDGYQATKEIRSLNRDDAKIIPIVALSANSFDEDIKATLECGMNNHLSKPINNQLLYNEILKYKRS